MPFSISGDATRLSGYVFLAALLSTLLFVSSSALAQVPAGPASNSGELFELPESFSNVRALAEFIESIDALEPEDRSEQVMIAHERKVARTVVAAADKMLTQQLSDEDAMQSTYFKLQGLRFLVELREPKAELRLNQTIEAARADKRADVQAVGNKFMIETGFAKWATWDEQERTTLVDNIIKHITGNDPSATQINMMMSVIDFLGDMNGEKHARKMMAKLMPHFQTSADPRIQRALVSLQGVQRRLELPGNEIQLEGTMLDGSELDWESYRGKVVLVDFWATWCGPCRAEVPNVMKMYEAYHDKGFEVLGISLDERREQAESYIKQTKIPWPTMFSEKPEERGWQNPMAVRYGINGIPRAILVNREGKVVHMTARGEALGRELRKLLGEPVASRKRSRVSTIQRISNPISID